MSAQPLTHHEILGLVAPFTRAGRRTDLAASDRLARRIAFQPLDHAATDTLPALHETLHLDSFGTGTSRLTRVLTLPGGQQATLQATGTDPGELLARVQAVPAARQFHLGPGFVIARSYWLQPPPGPLEPVLTQADVQLDGLSLSLSLSSVKGVAADLVLAPTGPEPLDLPQDLLAVLGWDWARLLPDRGGWKSKLRLRGDSLQRSRGAEQALVLVATHLALTLGEPPARFHDRRVRARWGVAFRRGIPVLNIVFMLAVLAVLPHVMIEPAAGPLLLLFHVPTALIALSFTLQELPRFEIPPRPRRSAAASWRRADG